MMAESDKRIAQVWLGRIATGRQKITFELIPKGFICKL